jgi:hypothetical protein
MCFSSSQLFPPNTCKELTAKEHFPVQHRSNLVAAEVEHITPNFAYRKDSLQFPSGKRKGVSGRSLGAASGSAWSSQNEDRRSGETTLTTVTDLQDRL